MRRSALIAAVTSGLVLGAVGPALASVPDRDVPDTHQVVVFTNELVPLQAYPDPHGCQRLPALSHVLNNETSRYVYLHADLSCLTPGIPIRPGYGSHTTQAFGSFSS
ncbi:hypothetical protein [Streptomyces colonosanans]|uniref:Uncharacterized protein n=1 Tax=Streptomyces colonosanans TaxID=1428652 RepID=A0A1S2PX80_9ACTN|nr:hypothetical protein [Streptomyces colonosanans]OIJ98447.1 hypothetical protein BIV24_06330 [Streptomyces colonosanans]